jgi:hypothetical protein
LQSIDLEKSAILENNPSFKIFVQFWAFKHNEPLLEVDVIFQTYSLMENYKGHTRSCHDWMA